MKGSRVEGQQLGAQTETVTTLDTPRSCVASKVARLTRIPGSGGPSL